MRTIEVFLAVLLAGFIITCNKDDENPTPLTALVQFGFSLTEKSGIVNKVYLIDYFALTSTS